MSAANDAQPWDTDSPENENPNGVALTFRAAPLGNAVKDFYPLKNGGVAHLTLGSNPQRPEMTSIPHRPRVGGKMIEG